MDIVFHKPILPKSLDELYTDSMINGWLTTGPQVQKFESIISEYTQSKYAVAVNSCTAALHLALAAKNFGIGDKCNYDCYNDRYGYCNPSANK